jgi:LysR family glycine cleavage system transcriptional activator
MARRLPSLGSFRVFEAVARHMNFTRAGDELCVTQGAVSRSIRGLEDDLGVPLFVRLPRKLELTEEGRSLSLSTRDALDMLERAVLRISNRGDARILTINVLPTFATKWLMPKLVEFNQLHSNIEVRLITSIRPVDFSNEDVDVAIRVGRIDISASEVPAPRIDLVMTETFTGVRAEHLLPDALVPLVSPALLKKTGPVKRIADLAKFTLIHNTTRKNAWPDWLGAAGETKVDATKGLFFGHFFLALQAAANGQGVALIPRVLAEDDIAARRLVVPINQPIQSAGAYFLLCRQHHWDVPKVRIFREWLKQTCEATAPH